jgi:hypothetical protein
MIVATTIMAIAVVGLMSGLSTATRNAARLQDYDRAVQLGRLRMNELILDKRIPHDSMTSGMFDPALAGGMEAGWTARLSTFESPPSIVPGLILERIELQVWWMSGDRRRTFTLDSFRPRQLSPQERATLGAPR